MVNKLIAYCARHTFIVLLFILFAAATGFWAVKNIPLDAIPDLSDVQVIIYTHWPGRSPDIVEDQVTYPIVSRMVSAPDVQSVRAQTMFGDSFVYVIFKDGTDIYWGRSRVVEYLQGLQNSLPEGVTPVIGPDATGVGWIFEYALMDKSGKQNLEQLRGFQDWHLRYWLESVDGVSEVASVGGFVKQYQINVD
ncbi:MAG: efflux RND transporter permease subunit, partial [Blastocatellia bacterium]